MDYNMDTYYSLFVLKCTYNKTKKNKTKRKTDKNL